MCIMEVREGQRTATIAQAMAHNTGTVERDMDLLRALLVARGDVENLARVERAQVSLRHAYSEFLAVFGTELAHDVDAHHSDAPIANGNERQHGHIAPADAAILSDALTATRRARPYESR